MSWVVLKHRRTGRLIARWNVHFVPNAWGDAHYRSQPARQEASQPGTHPDVEKSLHDNLAGERSGQGRVLPRRKERQRKHCAGKV